MGFCGPVVVLKKLYHLMSADEKKRCSYTRSSNNSASALNLLTIEERPRVPFRPSAISGLNLVSKAALVSRLERRGLKVQKGQRELTPRNSFSDTQLEYPTEQLNVQPRLGVDTGYRERADIATHYKLGPSFFLPYGINNYEQVVSYGFLMEQVNGLYLQSSMSNDTLGPIYVRKLCERYGIHAPSPPMIVL